MQLFDLSGKTAVVLGGASTLGRAMAASLAAHGAHVAISGRNEQKLLEIKEAIEQTGGKAAIVVADATKKSDLETILNEVLAWTCGVDIVVHCPGTNSATAFLEIEAQEWDQIIDVNAKSVMFAAQVFGQYWINRKRGGSLILISSVSSTTPLSKVFTYSASKAAINNMTQFLANEFAKDHIRVNAILPGFFPAEQNRSILSPERTAAIMQHTPMNRFGKPEELGGAVVFLASERASGFVTGSLIRVDGGFGSTSI